MMNLPPTPIKTLEKHHAIAQEVGLNYAYLGNVPGHRRKHTYWSECKAEVVERTVTISASVIAMHANASAQTRKGITHSLISLSPLHVKRNFLKSKMTEYQRPRTKLESITEAVSAIDAWQLTAYSLSGTSSLLEPPPRVSKEKNLVRHPLKLAEPILVSKHVLM